VANNIRGSSESGAGMRLAAGLMAILPVAAAWGDEPPKSRPAWMEREWRLGGLEERALTVYPRRRDTPSKPADTAAQPTSIAETKATK
jgi:hypothetical protein